jgi:hypothetical protein
MTVPDHASMDAQATYWNKKVKETEDRVYSLQAELEVAGSELELYKEIQASVQGYRTGLIHYRAYLERTGDES